MNCRYFAFLAMLSSLLFLGASPQKEKPHGPVILQVDHILVESGDPKALFSFFADTLQLPKAWSLAENNGFISGGIGAGDVNLEVFRYADQKKKAARKTAEARFSGLAFEPYPLSKSLHELELRGIKHSPPEAAAGALPDGSRGTTWTTVALPSISRPGMSIFLYEYSPKFLKAPVRRAQMGNRLALTNGGALGFKSIREIVIATTHLESDIIEWRKLLEARTSRGSFRAVVGPAIRLVAGKDDRILEITCQVASLERAKAFLQKNKLLGPFSSQFIYLNPLQVQGLKIRLIP